MLVPAPESLALLASGLLAAAISLPLIRIFYVSGRDRSEELLSNIPAEIRDLHMISRENLRINAILLRQARARAEERREPVHDEGWYIDHEGELRYGDVQSAPEQDPVKRQEAVRAWIEENHNLHGRKLESTATTRENPSDGEPEQSSGEASRTLPSIKIWKQRWWRTEPARASGSTADNASADEDIDWDVV